MSPEKIASLLRQNKIPQQAVCQIAGLNTWTLSCWLRSLAVLPERTREDIEHAVVAMIELSDESSIPPDWRQVARMKPALLEKIAGYRAARTRELHNRFLAGEATA